MVLFDLNTGLREDVVCSLRWDWEAQVRMDKERTISVFVVPSEHVKGRKREQIIVCNSVAQEVLESQRDVHAQFVFTYAKPIGKKQVQPTPCGTRWASGCA